MNEEEQRNIDYDEFRSEENSAMDVDGTPPCCIPVPCGFRVGGRKRSLAERDTDWREETRGWSGL